MILSYQLDIPTAEVTTGENITIRVFDKDKKLMSEVNIIKSKLKHCKDNSMTLTMILMYVFVFAILAVVIIILIYCYKKKKSVKVGSVAKVPQSSIKIFVKDSNPRDNTNYY